MNYVMIPLNAHNEHGEEYHQWDEHGKVLESGTKRRKERKAERKTERGTELETEQLLPYEHCNGSVECTVMLGLPPSVSNVGNHVISVYTEGCILVHKLGKTVELQFCKQYLGGNPLYYTVSRQCAACLYTVSVSQ